jgi:four helix bundle suffix protein
MSAETPLLPHGGYENLRSYKVAAAVYDATVVFCDRFISKGSRTHDQMVQAARSGVRNISEGSGASATSRKTELKLTNVALASLKDELLRDFESFLQQRGLPVWSKDEPQALALRERLKSAEGLAGLALFVAGAGPEAAANALLCATHQATYLLRRQLESLGRDFLEHGGFTERLYAARSAARDAQKSALSDVSDKSDRSDRSDLSDSPAPVPLCPECGKPMRKRTAKVGSEAGKPFWGCSGYPECRGFRRC